MKDNKKPDFHLILDSSPWPIVISISIFILVFGLIRTIHKQIFGIFSLFLGMFITMSTLFYWWRDMIKENIHNTIYSISKKENVFGIAMYLFIFSEFIFFMTFFSSFFKSWLDPVFLFEDFSPIKRIEWPPQGILPPDPWSLPFMNTLILLFSGTTINWAYYSLLENDKNNMIKMLLVTILLGILFIVFQVIEYHKTNFSLQETTGEKLIYASNFYIITGFHCMHVVIGIIFLLVCLLRVLWGQFSPQNHLCFKFASWYWHFVDIIWIFLFVFIYWLSVSYNN